jgi:integrase
MRERLTKRTIDALKPRATAVLVWDRELPRFGLKVTPAAARVYVVQYRFGGRVRRLTIGHHGHPWTVDAARTEAHRLLGLVAAGQDPARAKAAGRTAPTVRELSDRFLREHVTKLKPTTAREVRRLLEGLVLPALGSLHVEDVTAADVAKLHHRLRATPYQANRTLAACHKLFALAERWGLRPPGSNPARVEKYRERARRRYLTVEELGRLGAMLALAEQAGTLPVGNKVRSIDRFTVAAIRLLLYTGARLSEILTLSWDAVDLERGVLRLTDSKTGQKDIMLNGPALAILQGLPRVDDNPHVIPGRRDGAPRTDIHGAWNVIRAAAALEDARLHDLRHHYASVGVNAGLGLPMIGGLLGHRTPATTARYSHLAADPLKAANAMIGDRIAAALAGQG